MHIAYLLTGGNEGDRSGYLATARAEVEQICGEVMEASSQYESEPWGIHEQATYYNQALKVATVLDPPHLLRQLLSIEERLGRTRDVRYGPRTIDIDILLYEDAIIDAPFLKVPHPQLEHRRFALQCLHDIAPLCIHPVLHKTVHQLLIACTDPLWVRKLD